jgi:hypothetical protein
VYSAARDGGLISFALETGTKNATQTVPGILVGEIHPVLSSGSLTGASVYQSAIIKGSGDQANSYGATMQALDGSFWMVSDRMSSTLDPGIMLRVNRTTDALNTFETAVSVKGGAAATLDIRWGDYEAASLDDNDHAWFASEYSPLNQDWATTIFSDH